MDVERIQKVNNLALDLMKQGLATTREDAIAQAEKVFGNDPGAQHYNEIRETIVKVEAHKRKEMPEAYSRIETQKEPKGLSEDKIKSILKQNTEFIVKSFKEFNEKIQVLERQVYKLHAKVSSERLPTVTELVAEEAEKKAHQETVVIQSPEPIQVQTQVNHQQTPVQQAPQVVAQKQAPKPHPRVGNFTDTDVSIEKFFYMGNK